MSEKFSDAKHFWLEIEPCFDDECYRVVLSEIDDETQAMVVLDIFKTKSFSEAVNLCHQHYGNKDLDSEI